MSWQLVLFTDRARKSLNKIKKEIIEEDSSRLLNDFQQLLLDALGLVQELEGVDGHSYLSHIDLPSIAPHWQNDRCFSDWVVLIELLRDSWLEIRRIDPCRASQIAQSWFDFPYPSFKRLALFAASQDDCIPQKLWVEWIVDDNARWLWSEHTRRETMRLMVAQASNLTKESVQAIEAAILKGPSRDNYLANLSPEQSDEIVRSSIKIRLSKLAHSEKILSDIARSKLQRRSSNESDWQKLRDNERNEFVIWRSGTGAPDFEESRIFHRAPSDKNELVVWLKEMSLHRSSFHEDDWQEICRSRFEDCISALSILSSEEQWPIDRWSQALYAWSSEDCENCSWQSVLEALHQIPIEKLEKIAHSVAFWADSTSQSVDTYDADFLNLCEQILTATYEDKGVAEDPVASAINHPIGLVTSALLNIWFNQNPGDNEPLPTEIETILTNICDTKTPCQRYGRVILASRLVPIFRADSVWAIEKLLPILDWSDDQNEALAAWCGLLWSPRLYPPLLVEIKQHFLTTAKHYSSLGKWKHSYSELLTHVGLAHVADYSEQDLQEALKNLNEDGLPTVARTLYQALDNSESQREEYWNNRIKPFLQKIWPQSNEFASKEIAEEFAAIAIAADSKFVEALGVAFDWLEPLDLPDRVILILKESEIHKQFPKESLCLLNAIISEQSQDVFGLREVLDRIVEASSSLSNEPKYVRLEQICRRYGY